MNIVRQQRTSPIPFPSGKRLCKLVCILSCSVISAEASAFALADQSSAQGGGASRVAESRPSDRSGVVVEEAPWPACFALQRDDLQNPSVRNLPGFVEIAPQRAVADSLSPGCLQLEMGRVFSGAPRLLQRAGGRLEWALAVASAWSLSRTAETHSVQDATRPQNDDHLGYTGALHGTARLLTQDTPGRPRAAMVLEGSVADATTVTGGDRLTGRAGLAAVLTSGRRLTPHHAGDPRAPAGGSSYALAGLYGREMTAVHSGEHLTVGGTAGMTWGTLSVLTHVRNGTGRTAQTTAEDRTEKVKEVRVDLAFASPSPAHMDAHTDWSHALMASAGAASSGMMSHALDSETTTARTRRFPCDSVLPAPGLSFGGKSSPAAGPESLIAAGLVRPGPLGPAAGGWLRGSGVSTTHGSSEARSSGCSRIALGTGVTTALDERTRVGMAGGYAHTRLSNPVQTIEAHLLSHHITGRYDAGPIRLESEAIHTFARYHTSQCHRRLGTGCQAADHSSGHHLAGVVSARYSAAVGITLTPLATLHWGRLTPSRATDHRVEFGNLGGSDAAPAWLVSTLGVVMQHTSTLAQNFRFLGEIRARWRHAVDDLNQGAAGPVAAALSRSLPLPKDTDAAGDGSVLGIGVTVQRGRHLHVFVGYDAVLTPDTPAHHVTSGIRLRW